MAAVFVALSAFPALADTQSLYNWYDLGEIATNTTIPTAIDVPVSLSYDSSVGGTQQDVMNDYAGTLDPGQTLTINFTLTGNASNVITSIAGWQYYSNAPAPEVAVEGVEGAEPEGVSNSWQTVSSYGEQDGPGHTEVGSTTGTYSDDTGYVETDDTKFMELLTIAADGLSGSIILKNTTTDLVSSFDIYFSASLFPSESGNVPLPAALPLFGLGLASLAARRVKRNKA